MAYNPLNVADIVAGKPTKEEIFQTIRSNQEQFNSDISLLQGISKIDMFDLIVAGFPGDYTPAQHVQRATVFKAPVNAKIVSVVMTLLATSTSGTLELDLEKSTDNGANWNPLLNNPVQLTGTTVGSVSGSVDWISVPLQSFNQNDLIRATIVNVQVGQGIFHISIYGELS